MVQIFVKMDGSKTFSLMVSPSDKVDEVMRRIRNNVKSSEVYMTCEGRVLRWSDELRSSGVGDGCTVQIKNMSVILDVSRTSDFCHGSARKGEIRMLLLSS